MQNVTEMLVDSVELQLNHHTLGQDFSIEIGEQRSQEEAAENAFVSGESKLYILHYLPQSVHFEHGFSVPAPQETYLEKFCLWQRKQKISCQCHWDYAVLLTGPGIYRYISIS